MIKHTKHTVKGDKYNEYECETCHKRGTYQSISKHKYSTTCRERAADAVMDTADNAPVYSINDIKAIEKAGIEVTAVPMRVKYYAPKWAVQAITSYRSMSRKDDNKFAGLSAAEYLSKMKPDK